MNYKAIYSNKKHNILCVAVLFLLSACATNPTQLNGYKKQGSILFGTTEIGSRIYLNDKEIEVSNSGDFLIAFSRNEKAKHRLTTITKNNKKFTEKIKIQKEKWKIEKLNNLPKNKVNPKSKEDLAKIKYEFSQIKKARNNKNQTPFYKSGFIMPAKGRISGVFGSQRILNGKPKSPHSGTDIAAIIGTKIIAPADGIISLVEKDLFYTGNVVMIDHGLGLQTIYAHMHKIYVKKGQKVKKGQEIGEIGKTGRVTGPHLHWGASLVNIKFNPMNLIENKE